MNPIKRTIDLRGWAERKRTLPREEKPPVPVVLYALGKDGMERATKKKKQQPRAADPFDAQFWGNVWLNFASDANGYLSYRLTPTDTDTGGIYEGDFEVVFPDATREHYPGAAVGREAFLAIVITEPVA